MRNGMIIAAVLALGAVGVGWWLVSSKPESPVDQHNVNDSPPSSATADGTSSHDLNFAARGYVDDATCAACHEQIAADFAGHSMGRSLAELADVANPAPVTEGTGNPFEFQNVRYTVTRNGDKLEHRESYLDANGQIIAELAAGAAYAVGSATRGRSYLVQRGDHLFLSPITWYPQKGQWQLSPGYEDHPSHFNRPVTAECLFCHANLSQPIEHTLNTYRDPPFLGHAIGCQRCHGPGAYHVAEQTDDATYAGPREEIVNPVDLKPVARDQVCMQCHLSGEARIVRRGKNLYDYRPGEPLDDVLQVFITAEGKESTEESFVGHFEQMFASRCYQESGGEMTCFSCHDPHVLPEQSESVAWYRERCLTCHQEDACHAEAAIRAATHPADNCMSCHMPELQTEIRHAAVTDHRIMSVPGEEETVAVATLDNPLSAPLVPFLAPAGGFQADDLPELARDTAIAIVGESGSDDSFIEAIDLRRATTWLKQAIRRHPDDLAALSALAGLAVESRDAAAATKLYEQILQLAPDHEQALAGSATVASARRDHVAATRKLTRLVKQHPWSVRYRVDLIQALGQQGRWSEAGRLARQTVRDFPHSNRAHQLRIESLLAARDHAAADEAFATWLRYRPAPEEQLNGWYKNHPLRR